MTTLTITPDSAKKRLKLAGTVASGEKVAVTVVGFGSAATDNLRLRVMAGGCPVGLFPLEESDAWTVSGDDLTCELNLFTEQAEKLCKFGAAVCVLLEDIGTPQLYGAAELTLLPWVKLTGDDVPIDLYRSWLEEFAVHMASKENPHGVTAAQVGLGNVDDTADRDKPVSTAQAAAITAAAAGVSASVTTEVTRATNAENALAVEIDALGNRVDALDADVTVADAKADVAKSAADAAKSAADAQKERLDKVRTEVAEISKPKASINSLKASIEALLTALEEM